MLLKNISILTEDMRAMDSVDVLIKDDRIQWISPKSDNREVDEGEEEIHGESLLMIPAFYNAHGHSPMALMRGYGENLNLQDWLFNKIFPFEDKLTPEAVYYGTLLTVAESIKYGIISTSDMYYFIDDMVKAVIKSGIKANISRAITNPTGEDFESLQSVQEMMDAVEKYNGIENGRIKIDGSLHGEYTSDENTAVELAELTKKLGLLMHVHVSETETEHKECKERHEGRTPVKYLADAGIFDVPAIAAHCVWIEDEDVNILAEKGVTVASNPVSNLKLASGICDVKKLLDNDVKVAIGTDSVASNNNLNMFEEMKTLSLLSKIKNNNPKGISSEEIFLMATRSGALAQGREDSGFIKEGYKADFLLIKKNSPNMEPAYDIINNLVYSATDSDIYMTVADGKVLYRDGEFLTIDIEDTIKGVKKAVKDITDRL